MLCYGMHTAGEIHDRHVISDVHSALSAHWGVSLHNSMDTADYFAISPENVICNYSSFLLIKSMYVYWVPMAGYMYSIYIIMEPMQTIIIKQRSIKGSFSCNGRCIVVSPIHCVSYFLHHLP